MSPDEYRRRPVLVLGGLGFIGSNLVDRLLTLGAQVALLTPVRERHEDVAQRLEGRGASIIEGDIRDRGLMAQLVATAIGDAAPSVIFNLSGQSGAVRSMEDPWTDLEVNCRGNLVLLESVRDHNPTARVVFVGSRLQYGRQVKLPVKEDAAIDPLCLHAVHKQTVEQYFRLYGQLFALKYAVARLTNPYGPGQPRGRTAYGVVNRMIHLALSNDLITIYGDGLQARDYVLIDDVVEALLCLGAHHDADRGVFNVGSGVATRMIDLARQVIQLAGSGRIQHVPWPALAERIETGDFVADIGHIQERLGWSPRVDLGAGLMRTIAFYRQLQPA